VIEPLHRCVFTALQKVVPGFLVSGASNTPRAAMPSLHAGVTLLMAMLLLRELGFRRAWWSLLLLVLISFEIVYGAEHFVTDIAVGYLFAAAAYWFSRFPGFGK
jgi:membrane-associated phospholipid phosphatase